jgi:hypothetical protein
MEVIVIAGGARSKNEIAERLALCGAKVQQDADE